MTESACLVLALVLAVALPAAFAAPPFQAIQIEEVFDANSVSLIQLGDSDQNGVVVISGLSVPFSLPINSGKWWDDFAANNYIKKNCTPTDDAKFMCKYTQIDDLFDAGLKNCTQCDQSQYLFSACSSKSDSACAICAKYEDGTYQAQACTTTANAVYLPCRDECENGLFQTVACSALSNRVCTPCSKRNNEQFVTNQCESGKNNEAGQNTEFKSCTACSNKEYETSPCGGNDGAVDRSCTSCLNCSSVAGTYQRVPCGTKSNTVCSECTTCKEGSEFLASECTPFEDAVCIACATCLAHEYEASNCTATSNRVCKNCTTSTDAGYFISVPCTLTSDAQIEKCTDACEIGKYQTSPCSTFSDIKCGLCTHCDDGKFAVTLCNDHQDTTCQQCKVCSSGTYATGGCAGANDTSCTKCEECGVGHIETGACTNSTNRVCRPCTSVNHAEFTTDGTCDIRCQKGYHKSADGSSCLVCSTCNPDTEYLESDCTETSDSICAVKAHVGGVYGIGLGSTSTAAIALDDTNFAFKSPVLIVSPPSLLSAIPTVIRASQSTTSNSFNVWLTETGLDNSDDNTSSSSTDSTRQSEDASYLILDEGKGPNYFVGAILVNPNATADARATIHFNASYTSGSSSNAPLGNLPFIFPFIQTNNNKGSKNFLKPRVSLEGNSATEFEILLESFEGYARGELQSELVGFLAIDSGCKQTHSNGDASVLTSLCPTTQFGTLNINGRDYQYALGVTESFSGVNTVNPVSFDMTFKSKPYVFASVLTYRAKNAELRIQTKTTGMFSYVIEADASNNGHISESVAWLAIAL